jgi:hypothetical protein
MMVAEKFDTTFIFKIKYQQEFNILSFHKVQIRYYCSKLLYLYIYI